MLRFTIVIAFSIVLVCILGCSDDSVTPKSTRKPDSASSTVSAEPTSESPIAEHDPYIGLWQSVKDRSTYLHIWKAGNHYTARLNYMGEDININGRLVDGALELAAPMGKIVGLYDESRGRLSLIEDWEFVGIPWGSASVVNDKFVGTWTLGDDQDSDSKMVILRVSADEFYSQLPDEGPWGLDSEATRELSKCFSGGGDAYVAITSGVSGIIFVETPTPDIYEDNRFASGFCYVPASDRIAPGEWIRTSHHPDVDSFWMMWKTKIAIRTAVAVNACAWSPDGKRLLSADDEHMVRIWEADTGRTLQTLKGHEGAVNACAWSPDGKRVLSAGDDTTVRIWEVDTGRTLQTLKGHRLAVLACAWSPDGKRVLSAGDDFTVRIWDVDTGRAIHTLESDRTWVRTAWLKSVVRACAWSPDGMQLLSAGDGGKLQVWDAKTGYPIRKLSSGSEWDLLACAWSPDGTRLLAAGFDGALHIWGKETDRAIVTLQLHAIGANACAWSPDSTRVLSAGGDRTVYISDAETGSTIHTLDGHLASASACAWSPDGTRVLSGGDDGTLRIWNARTGDCLQVIAATSRSAISEH